MPKKNLKDASPEEARAMMVKLENRPWPKRAAVHVDYGTLRKELDEIPVESIEDYKKLLNA